MMGLSLVGCYVLYFDSSQIMTLFIYQNDKLYADTRKTSSFPNAEVIKPVMETKVVKTPYCMIAMGGIPLPPEEYIDQITLIESICAVREVMLSIYDDDEGAIRSDYVSFEKVLQHAITAVTESKRFLEKTFVAMTAENVWCMTGNPGDPIRRYENNGSCAAGAGDEFAKILLTNDISPEDIYPASRRVGIPVGETCEIHHRSELNAKLKPPFRSRIMWISVLRDMINREDSIEKADLLKDLMFFVDIINVNKAPYCGKFSKQLRKILMLWIHDRNNKQFYKNTADYKKFAKIIDIQVKERIL